MGHRILSARNPEKTLIKTHRKNLKTSNLAYTMLLDQGSSSRKKKKKKRKEKAFFVPIGFVRLTRYCGNHDFP